MTDHPTCVSPETEIRETARLIRDLGVGALPVCEGDRLVGIVTDRDIVVRHLAEQRRTETVAEIMTRDPYVVGPDEPVEQAESLMAHHQVRRLPVCEDARLVGFISQADVARHATHEEVGALLEAISRP
jgi:CBS domain-containing protein